MLPEASRPCVLVVDDEALFRDFAEQVLTATGWRVTTADGGAQALARLTDAPHLVLMDLCMAPMTGPETVAAIRGRRGPLRSVPILAFTTTRIADPGVLYAQGFDGLLPKPCTPDELAAAAARWMPDDRQPVLDRLVAGFGAEAIAGLTERLSDALAEGLRALDGPDARETAHRLAGIAGTLGFAAVSRTWQAVSEGDDSQRVNARIEARRAIAAIDQRRTDRRPSTSV